MCLQSHALPSELSWQVLIEESFNSTIVCALLEQVSVFQEIKFFTVYTNLAKMAVLASTNLTTAKNKLPAGLNLMQEIIIGLGVEYITD